MENTGLKIRLRERKSGIIYAALGFLLGLAPLASEVMPFGLAFLCAVPKKSRKSCFYGVLAASFFDICAPLALFCAVYLYLVLAAKELLRAPIDALFGGHLAARSVRYFLIVVVGGVLWPMTFRYFAKLGKKEKN